MLHCLSVQHLKWPEYGKNSTSVGELWLELLNFYSEEFDFENYVISIRRKHPLLKFEKLWKSKFIKIEDPFDINHNLGSALSRNSKYYTLPNLLVMEYIVGQLNGDHIV